jgi:hypothetical protein
MFKLLVQAFTLSFFEGREFSLRAKPLDEND